MAINTNDYRQNQNIWIDINDLRNYQRYQGTIARSGLSEDERELIPNVIRATNAYDALKAANQYLYHYSRQTFRCSYNTKFFLEAIATNCEADLAGV
jgi:hypothetical protein